MGKLRLEEKSGEWLKSPSLQKLFDLLLADVEEAMIVGGAVRNSLLGLPVSDLDICTTRTPDNVMALMDENGIKTVPTGVEHGTVTIVIDGEGFEVTTLREDMETFGRHATVKFGRDWVRDAERRDLTINALYCDRDGQVHDVLGGGIKDLEAGMIRFIGDAETRIREDFLRILRFYRFFAHFGRGRPDAEGLKACARMKDGIEQLSVERVWKEFKTLLSARDPGRALLWMRQTGVLDRVLPESTNWGIDLIPDLISAEVSLGWVPDAEKVPGSNDPMPRLMAIIRPDHERVSGICKRLKLSGKEKDRLAKWVAASPLDPEMSEAQMAKALYGSRAQGADQQGVIDATLLDYARARQKGQEDSRQLERAGGLFKALQFAAQWKRPVFPVKGKHLINHGMKAGKGVGGKLQELETEWVENGFVLTDEMQQLLQKPVSPDPID